MVSGSSIATSSGAPFRMLGWGGNSGSNMIGGIPPTTGPAEGEDTMDFSASRAFPGVATAIPLGAIATGGGTSLGGVSKSCSIIFDSLTKGSGGATGSSWTSVTSGSGGAFSLRMVVSIWELHPANVHWRAIPNINNPKLHFFLLTFHLTKLIWH